MLENLWSFLVAWYNLPFTFMLALGVLLALLQFVGLSHDGDADADADVDVGADVHADLDAETDIDADTDLSADHDFDHDLDHDVDHEVDHDMEHDVGHGLPSGFSLLAFIGMGKAPLMIVLLILFMSIGFLGWILNGIGRGIFGFFPGLLLLVTGLGSLIGGGLLTSRITRLIGRALPPISTTATRAQALVGRPGTVTSPFVDNRYGMVHLRDDGGTLISIFATTEDEQPIARGEDVILLSYDAAQRRYIVTRR
jgi:membrane protein implicated in regulation of membrane protease activity